MIGTYDGLCNRSACREPGAKWWNTSTRKYYCVMCASRINLECRRMNEEPICEHQSRSDIEHSQESNAAERDSGDTK